MNPIQAMDRNPLYQVSRRRFPFWCGAALLAGLLLRLWFISSFSLVPDDSLMYGDIARNWMQHGIYGITRMIDGISVPQPTLIRLPGYPLFLAACFRVFGYGRYTPVLLVQVVVDLGTCWLLSLLASGLFGCKAQLPALWLGSLCPFTALYVAMPLTETLTLFCMAVAFYGLWRWQVAGAGLNRWVGVIAAALAYAILLRPEQGMLAACVVPAMLWMAPPARLPGGPLREARPAVIVAVLTLLPLVPWAIRNERTFHLLQPLAPRYATDPGESNPFGFQRWYRTWAIDFASTENTYWPYEGNQIQVSDLPNRAFDSDSQYAATASLIDEYNLHTTSTPGLDARFDALARERIRANPLRYYLALPLARLLNMIFRPRADTLPIPLEWWKLHAHLWTTLVACSLIVVNLGYVVLAAGGFWTRRRMALDYGTAAPLLWCMAGSIVLRSALLLTLDNSETRYTLEFFPVLIVFGAGSLASRPFTFRRVLPDQA